MKPIILFIYFFSLSFSYSQDTTFWQFAADFEVGQSGSQKHSWGSETITYLGTVQWKSPSGKLLEIKLITSYRKITKANGFKDQNILALVKTNNTLIKTFDFVKTKNLPVEIRDNKLVIIHQGNEIISPMPDKFTIRFCVEGLTCFNQINLDS